MNFEEYAAKPLLAEAGIAVPPSRLAATPDEAAEAARTLGAVVVKAQAPTGKRGKAGGITRASTPEDARAAARKILGMEIGGHAIRRVLVEAQAAIERELYAAVLNDPSARAPLVLFSTEGGMEIEEVAAATPERLRRCNVDIRKGFGAEDARTLVKGSGLGKHEGAVARVLQYLYGLYRALDAELLEINPLAITAEGPVALDCKFVMDDSAVPRHAALAAHGTPEKLSPLEQQGKELSLKFIQLDGNVGVLANGAGLTMATMDMVRHWGGRPANFLEIGGESYTRAKPALELVLANPQVKSLVVNFCGAFARCDVMTEGVAAAWQELKPAIPIFFSIDGTGDVEAIQILKTRLGLDPFPTMALACKAAVEAAR